MSRVITEKEYEIHYYEADYRKQALMTSLIDYFNDVATFQSEKLGVGIDYMKENNMAWILYKWDINIKEYPKYGEKVIVRTEPCAVKKFYAYRKFYIFNMQKEVIATASSVWLLIDIREKKPLRVTADLIKAYGLDDDNDGILKTDNIIKINEEESSLEFKVRYSDIDTNGHVNNEKYAAWLIESVPIDIVTNRTLVNMKITYKKETKYGENIRVLTASKPIEDKIVFSHRILNKNGDEITLGETTWK
ncbi:MULTISPECIES: acyl-[acyl-carrier-protein] thioesterase [Clostridium]|uniref:Acyl-ACP thioesterase n=2 Tax=Clostridium TaxID=1485 RepID=A0A151AKB9_9CLOT|nr:MULTISPECIES: acyl-ACP thioesterase domain-containing protein [Clostridium]KYH28073.1 acyl-ACP thioesterase [Clostridium colicanis DSM 13634]MBE6044900.1 acyl-ACP thioesterase [Clostridium thermopalmarium]PRR71144.1 Acyl-ACP thioesterase [Clostridium thermopalmarium DSM 5974]PVZ21012.1 medium-chain acyl-[acyl-carrier-protein] hydrolase [Clostridium thermopalmarium DSM 5974]